MDEKKFENYMKVKKGYILLFLYYEELTAEQVQTAFNNAIINNDGFFLLISSCFEKLTAEQVQIALNNTIKNKQAWFLSCFEKLTAEQVQIIFENAIINGMGNYLLKFGSEYLTEEQINILKNMIDLKQ